MSFNKLLIENLRFEMNKDIRSGVYGMIQREFAYNSSKIDGNALSKEYKDLKDYIAGCINGNITDYDVEKLSNLIQELYDNDEMSSSQYDDLMGYVQDM